MRISFKTENYMHQKSFPWTWRSVEECPKEAWCQSERPGRFLLPNSQTVRLWHSVSCLFVTELLRLPFSWYKFQLFAGDSVFFIIILKRIYAIYKQTHPPTRLEHCVYCQIFSSAESNLVAVGTSQLRIYLFYTQDEVGDGLCESFNGDFSRCIIENIFLDYQV